MDFAALSGRSVDGFMLESFNAAGFFVYADFRDLAVMADVICFGCDSTLIVILSVAEGSSSKQNQNYSAKRSINFDEDFSLWSK